MKASSLALLDGYLAASTLELFASHGLRIEARDFGRDPLPESLVSSIGFTSETFRGVLVLGLSPETAARCLPPNLRRPEMAEEYLADWTGELSNQLLGRLKERLARVGIDIALSTPTNFYGRDFRHCCSGALFERCLGFGGEGEVVVEFKADVAADFEFGEEVAAGETPSSGEAVFF